MREIKFRAWDSCTKTMLSSEFSEWDDFFINPDGVILRMVESGVWETYRDTRDVSDELIVMQYTGLKDKNGKEVYEGDIIIHCVEYGQNQFRDEIKGDVYFKDGCYYVNSNVSDRDGYFHKKISEVVSDFMPKKYSCEIIGNIYENPELLKL